MTKDGVKVEIESAAFLQSWHQRKLSAVTFRTPKTRRWNPEANTQDSVSTRHADVYVFALLAHKENPTVDPVLCQNSAGSSYVLSAKIFVCSVCSNRVGCDSNARSHPSADIDPEVGDSTARLSPRLAAEMVTMRDILSGWVLAQDDIAL